MTPLLKSRWFAASLQAGLWVLLFMIVGDLGGTSLKYPTARNAEGHAGAPIPVSKLLSLFFLGDWPTLLVASNSTSPFFTRHFIPPAVPPPPRVTTRKVELTYQGFFQTGEGPRHVFVKVGDSLFVGPLGAKAAGNFFVAEVNLQSLVLTNAAGQTNVLTFNTKKELEVPVP